MLRVLEGVISRRLLVNYRVDPEAARKLVPAPLEPLLCGGAAIAGFSLIKVVELRPRGLAPIGGLTIENMAHRIAVTAPAEGGVGERVPGLYVIRRDTESRLVATLGRPLFAASHRLARFEVDEDERHLSLTVVSDDGAADVEVEVQWGAAFSPSKAFASLGAAQSFFEECDRGFASGARPGELAMVRLNASPKRAEAVRLITVRSRFFEDAETFPRGAAELDGVIAMRSLPHEWVAVKEVPEILEEPFLPQMA